MNGSQSSHGRSLFEATPNGSAKPHSPVQSPLKISNENELLEFLASGNVKEVDCCFSDPLGQWQHCSFHPSMVRVILIKCI